MTTDRNVARARLKRLVAFAVLMDNSPEPGVLGRVPDYILEKWNLICSLPEELVSQPLDTERQARYQEYLRRWKI